MSPESIVDEFPALTAEQVFGAIAWYLGHQAEVDEFMAKLSIRWQELRDQNHEQHAGLLNRLREEWQDGIFYLPLKRLSSSESPG